MRRNLVAVEVDWLVRAVRAGCAMRGASIVSTRVDTIVLRFVGVGLVQKGLPGWKRGFGWGDGDLWVTRWDDIRD